MRRTALWSVCLLIVVLVGNAAVAETVYRGLFVSGGGPGQPALFNDVIDLLLCFMSAKDWKQYGVADNPTQARLASLISSTFDGAADEDISILVISSHGTTGIDCAPVDELPPDALNGLDEYICLRSPICDDAFGSGPVGQALANVAGSKILITSACHSGGLAGGTADYCPAVPDALLLSACTETEMSGADFGDTVFGMPHSYFLGSLVSGLLEDLGKLGHAVADADSSGSADVSEWMAVVAPKIQALNAKHGRKQTPTVAPAGSPLMDAKIYTPWLGMFYQHEHRNPEGVRAAAQNVLETCFPTAFCPVAEALYEKLLDIDAEGELVFELVKDYEVTHDGASITLYLKEGVVFHNNVELEAEHVVRNLTEDMTLFPVIYRPSLIDAGVVLSVAEIDRYAVRIDLAEGVQPLGFLEGLANLMGMVAYPDRAISGECLIGAGPFMFEFCESPNQEIHLSRFDGYYGELAAAPELVFIVVPESSTQELMLCGGEIHLLLGRGEGHATGLSESSEVSDVFSGPFARSLPPIPESESGESPAVDNMSLFVAVRADTKGYVDHPDGMPRLAGVHPPEDGEPLVVGLCDSLE